MSVMRGIYAAVTGMTEPLLPLILRWQASEESDEHRRERRGLVSTPHPGGVWWHAASLGEVAALEPVLERARKTHPSLAHQVTTTTVAGRERAAQRWGSAASLAPVDVPRAVRAAFDHRRPRSLVLVETELWPNMLEAARRGTIPVSIVNGRISERSWPRYRRLSGLFRPFLADMCAVGVRYETDAERFLELGVPREALRVTGNTKHDRLVVSRPAVLPWPEGPVWTVGSIHPGEEGVVLKAMRTLQAEVPTLRVVLAPRHDRAFDYFVDAVKAAGFRCARRSDPVDADAQAEVLVLDSHGELDAVYAASSVALIGGTLVPVGGHNPLEASAAGVPVLVGPHHANVVEDLVRLREVGGARVVAGDDDLLAALRRWLLDPEAHQVAAVASRTLVDGLRGASDRTLEWLEARGGLPTLPKGAV